MKSFVSAVTESAEDGGGCGGPEASCGAEEGVGALVFCSSFFALVFFALVFFAPTFFTPVFKKKQPWGG